MTCLQLADEQTKTKTIRKTNSWLLVWYVGSFEQTEN